MSVIDGPLGDPVAVLRELEQGDRKTLARCLSLAESHKPQHVDWVAGLLALRAAELQEPAFRIALSGPPGAGKSSLLEQLGLSAVAEGLRVAVLTVDPSSEKSGGSLLGDKTRMPRLGSHSQAFVRPSPSKREYGGIIHSLPTSVRLCELAGYQRIFVETVGVGQSEGDAADLVDCFVLVLSPGAGDVIQGLKRGITELCDFLVVNKADADPAGALALQQAYASALQLLRSPAPATFRVSALSREGVPGLWSELAGYWQLLLGSGKLQERRRVQTTRLFARLAEGELVRRLRATPAVAQQLAHLTAEVQSGALSVHAALRLLYVPGA